MRLASICPVPLVLFLLVAVAAPLEEDVAFQEGVRLYDDYEYERAVFRFRDALRTEGRAPSDKAVVLLWLGMTLAELGDFVGARQAFEEGVAIDPEVKPPLPLAPKVASLLDDVRAQQASASTAAPATSPTATSPTATSPTATSPTATSPTATSPAATSPAAASPAATSPAATPAPLDGGMPPSASHPSPPAPAPEEPAVSTQSVVVVGGAAAALAGVASLAAGAALGGLALDAHTRAVSSEYQAHAASADEEARRYGLAANVAYVVGGTVLALGAAAAVGGWLLAGDER